MYRRAIFSIAPECYKIFPFRQILKAIVDRANKENEEKSIKVYYADALMVISQSIAALSGGKYISQRLMDILEPPEQDGRTADEIIADLSEKIEKIGGGEDGELT